MRKAPSGDGRWIVLSINRNGRFTPGIARFYTDGSSPRLGAVVPIRRVCDPSGCARSLHPNGSRLRAVPIVTSEHSATVGAAQTLMSLTTVDELSVNGDGTD